MMMESQCITLRVPVFVPGYCIYGELSHQGEVTTYLRMIVSSLRDEAMSLWMGVGSRWVTCLLLLIG